MTAREFFPPEAEKIGFISKSTKGGRDGVVGESPRPHSHPPTHFDVDFDFDVTCLFLDYSFMLTIFISQRQHMKQPKSSLQNLQ